LEVTWLGDGCFRLRSRDFTLLFDPPLPGSGVPARSLGEADVIALSDDTVPALPALQGRPRVLSGPGEYEIAGVFITGVRTARPGRRNDGARRNVAYVVEIEELRVCYLGRIESVLTPDQAEDLNDAEVLFVPVGGHGVLDAAAAAEVISLLEPRIVVPMHFRAEGAASERDPLDPFLKQMGVAAAQPVPRLNVTKTSLPLETSVTLLENRRA
jgi:L-ascorbate metabolism protein UlaG (beta-lactamase superfamily)